MKSNQENMKPMEKLALLLDKNKKILTVVIIVLFSFLVLSAILSEINKKIEIKSATLAESAQDQFNNWLEEKDEEKKVQAEKELIDSINKIEKKYKGRYAYIRATLIEADYYYEKKDWVQSEASYNEIAKKYSKTYFAPIALIKAAVSAENNNNIEASINYLVSLVDKYKKSSAEAPRALFNIGRLYESKDNKEEALKYYKSLEEDFPTSNWTKLAIDRIIYLTK